MTTKTDGRPHRSRAAATTVVVVALLAAAAGGALWWRTQIPEPVDPRTVAIPAVAKPDAVTRYMARHGRPLVRFLNKTETLSADATKDDCAALVTELSRDDQPRRLAAIAQNVPDPTLGDAFGNHIYNVVAYLGACGRGTDLTASAADVEFSGIVARRQLDRVEAS